MGRAVRTGLGPIYRDAAICEQLGMPPTAPREGGFQTRPYGWQFTAYQERMVLKAPDRCLEGRQVGAGLDVLVHVLVHGGEQAEVGLVADDLDVCVHGLAG